MSLLFIIKYHGVLGVRPSDLLRIKLLYFIGNEFAGRTRTLTIKKENKW